MQKLTLLLFFCALMLGANAQDWEEVRFEDFEDGLTGLEGLENYGFSAYSRFGATGGSSDASIRTNLRLGRYVAFLVELSDSYEYRFSWNLKAVGSYTWVDFSLNEDLDEDLLVLLDNERISSSHGALPGTDYTSAVFSGYNGSYYLKLENRRHASGTTRRLYADNFRLERRLIAVIPPVSVSSNNLTVNEGASTQVCFDVEEAPTSDLSFDLVLTSNASPHFDDYATQNVNFPAGSSTTQCVSITTDALDEVQSPNTSYSFQIQNMLNGELPTNTTIQVEVIDQSPTPPPIINLVNQSLNLDEGAGMEVCLSISDAPEQVVSMEVALLGNASPHFDDYASTTLSFPAGSASNQCFTLNTDPLDQELSGDLSYTFVLQTPIGSEIGNTNQLTVNVSDQSVQSLPTIDFVTTTASMIAGEDLQICLSTSEAPTELAAVEVAVFGNNAPHFASFTTTIVQFPISETDNQCFNLSSLVAAEVTEPINYTFILQNPLAAELGTANNLMLTVNPQQAADPDCPYAGPDQTICAGEMITIGCPDDPDNPSPYCFKWEPEIGFVEEFGPTQPNPAVQPEETTTYTLYVTDGNGNLIAEEEVRVTAEGEQPEVEVVACEGVGEITLTAIVTSDESFTYEWNTSETSASIHIVEPGTYSVTVSKASGCIGTADFEITDVNALDPASNAAQIKQYFKDKGFFVLPIEVIADDDPVLLTPENNGSGRSSGGEIVDHARKLIQLQEETFNVATSIEAFLQDEDYTDFAERNAYITKNENFCESVEGDNTTRLIDQVEYDFLREEFSYWIHIWENPAEGGEDCLLVACKSPFVQGLSPSVASKVDYLSSLLSVVGNEDATFGYASKDQQILAVAFDNLVDAYEPDLGTDFLDQGQGAVPDPNDPLGGGPCGVEVTTELICLNSAGLPITIPAGYTPYWAEPEKLRGNFDPRALVGFSGRGDYFVGYRGINKLTGEIYHTGFKNQKSPKDKYIFPSLDNICRPIYFGTVTPFTEIGQEDCVNINASPEAYKTTLSYSTNSKRTGAHQADFDAIKDISGSNCDISNATSYVYNSCIPHISRANFDEATHTAVFNPFGGNSKLKGGILFKYEIKETIGGEEVVTGEKWIYGHFRGLDPHDFSYFIWNCEEGKWVDYIPEAEAEVENMPFFAALFGAVLETLDPEKWKNVEIGSDVWHTALDAVSFFPVIGEVADFINGVWYIAEGDYGNGLLTLVGAIPLAGNAFQLIRQTIDGFSSYAMKVKIGEVDVILDSKSLGRYKCVTSINFNAPNHSINHLISSFLFYSPDCNGTNSFKNNFDPSGLLSKAAQQGATELTEAATKELIDWLNIAIKEDAFVGKAFEKYPDLIKVWKQADFTALADQKKIEFLSWLGKMDAAKADEALIINRFLEKPELVRAWDAIGFSPLKKDITWLDRIEIWRAAGMSFAPLGSPEIIGLSSNSRTVGAILNGKLLSLHNISPFPGSKVGPEINNCQVYQSGNELLVTREPDITSYEPQELLDLQNHPVAHTLEEHGHTVTDEALQWRALTGTTPNGIFRNRTSDATKFSGPDKIKQALGEIGPNSSKFANKLNNLTPDEVTDGGFELFHFFQESMGHGFKAETTQRVDGLSDVTAIYRRDENTGQFFLISMYPQI